MTTPIKYLPILFVLISTLCMTASCKKYELGEVKDLPSDLQYLEGTWAFDHFTIRAVKNTKYMPDYTAIIEKDKVLGRGVYEINIDKNIITFIINNKDSIKNTFNIQYSFKENVNENEYKVADIILDNEYGTVIQFISGGEYTYISYPFMEVDFDRVHNIDYRGSAKRYYSKK